MSTSALRSGLKAGAVAGVLSGVPSTVHAVASGRSPIDAVEAAGSLLLPREAPRYKLVVAGIVAHGAISLGWGVVLAAVLPRRHGAVGGAVAGLAIAGLDLGIVGRRFPRIGALPVGAQVADHVAYGVIAGAMLSRGTSRRRARRAGTAGRRGG